VFTVPASPIDRSHPRDTHTLTAGETRIARVHNFPNNLVAGDPVTAWGGKFPFNDVEVGPANATGTYTQQDISRRSNGVWNLGYVQWLGGNICRGIQDGRFHGYSREKLSSAFLVFCSSERL
jgi:hypothetical protein